jgi:hypothetical protein
MYGSVEHSAWLFSAMWAMKLMNLIANMVNLLEFHAPMNTYRGQFSCVTSTLSFSEMCLCSPNHMQVEDRAPVVQLQLQEAKEALNNLSISETLYEELKQVGPPQTSEQPALYVDVPP